MANEFTQYQRKQVAELRPYVEGEFLYDISISQEDIKAGSPKLGDMIARNPKNHADQWLVAKAYFEENFDITTRPAAPVEAIIAAKDYLLSVSDTVAQQLQNQIVTLTLKKEDLEADNAALTARVKELTEAAQHLLHDIDDLVSNSEGVFGLHKNGDNSPWDELLEGGRYESWLLSVEGLRIALGDEAVADASAAERDVMAERIRQIVTEGWTPEHDDQWQYGELAGAAACYALNGATYKAPSHYPPRKVYAAVAEAHHDLEKEIGIVRRAVRLSVGEPKAPKNWPWNAGWWRPSDCRRNLVKAGALILAEIERLDRRAASEVKP